MSENQPDSAGRRTSGLDNAIDRAVRQMVRVDPPAGLPRRVLSRLAAPVVPSTAYSMRYLATAAALAMLVLAVGLLRRDSAPDYGIKTDSTMADARPAQVPQTAVAEAPGRSPEALTTAEPDARVAAEADARSDASRSRQATMAPRAPHTEVIPMPEIVNLFGAAGNTVTGATVSVREDAGRARLVDTAVASPIEITVLSIAPLEIEPLRITQIPAAAKQR